MECFLPVKKAVKTVTVQEIVAAIMYFRCTEAFNGKRREEAYNPAQKAAASVQKQALACSRQHCAVLHNGDHKTIGVFCHTIYMQFNTSCSQVSCCMHICKHSSAICS